MRQSPLGGFFIALGLFPAETLKLCLLALVLAVEPCGDGLPRLGAVAGKLGDFGLIHDGT